MALKSLLFVSLLLVVMVTGAAPAVAQLGLGNLLGLINIQGTLFCTGNGNVNSSSVSTPVFPNAVVQLQCGNTGTVVSSTTTNSAGVFKILLDPLTTLLSSLLSDCKLVVNTPLTNCNFVLLIGILQPPLQFLGRTLLGVLGIVNIGAAGFSLVPSNLE